MLLAGASGCMGTSANRSAKAAAGCRRLPVSIFGRPEAIKHRLHNRLHCCSAERLDAALCQGIRNGLDQFALALRADAVRDALHMNLVDQFGNPDMPRIAEALEFQPGCRRLRIFNKCERSAGRTISPKSSDQIIAVELHANNDEVIVAPILLPGSVLDFKAARLQIIVIEFCGTDAQIGYSPVN